MKLSRPFPGRSPGRTPPSRRPADAGLSLVELSVVMLIVSVIAALALPAYRRIEMNARTATVINDLRVFATAFQNYAHDRGEWPAAVAAPGDVPAGMTGYLSASNWQRTTPIGGAYSWAPNSIHQGERYRAAIVISAVDQNLVTADRQQLTDIDRKLDDGDLDVGNVRLGFRNEPVYILER